MLRHMKYTYTNVLVLAFAVLSAPYASAQTMQIQAETSDTEESVRADVMTTQTDEGDPDEPVIEGRIITTTATPEPDAQQSTPGNIGSSGDDGPPESDRAALLDRIGTTGTTAAGGYIKIGDIKGESTESKKGNVETEWQVEEGGKVTIEISGVQVRGWDPETKKEIVGAAPSTTVEVRNETDLAFLGARAAVQDEAIEHVSLNFERVRMDYRSQARLFGFLPVSMRMRTEADTDGSGRVKVIFPWWHILTSKSVDADTVVTAFSQASADIDLSAGGTDTEIAVRTQAEIFQTLSTVLKAQHEASVSVDK